MQIDFNICTANKEIKSAKWNKTGTFAFTPQNEVESLWAA